MPATRAQTMPGSFRRTVGTLLVLALLTSLAAFLGPAHAVQPSGDATPTAETDPVASSGDAADDAAIWVNPQDPARSVIIGTDKQAGGGLNVYDLSGARIQSITTDGLANNVDLRHGFSLAGGPIDVVATVGDGSLRFYQVDPATGHLDNVTSGAIQPPVPHGGNINGVCLYQSPVSHDTFAFVTAPTGQIQQLKLREDAANPGRITTELVRGGQPAEWDVSQAAGSPIENCVADDELQTLYVSEQDVAIW